MCLTGPVTEVTSGLQGSSMAGQRLVAGSVPAQQFRDPCGQRDDPATLAWPR